MKKKYKLLITICGVLSIVSWLYLYNYEYINIPYTKLFLIFYKISKILIFIVPAFLFILSLNIIIHRAKQGIRMQKIFLLITLILTINILAFMYTSYEVIYFKECYVIRKDEINDKYYIYTENETMIKCPKKIYAKIIPQKKYILTYRQNKLNAFSTNKIIAFRRN